MRRGALPVAANIGASAERETKTYTAQHKLLGVSSRQHESMIEIMKTTRAGSNSRIRR